MPTLTAQFQLEGALLSTETWGSGHINDTFVSHFDLHGGARHVIFQRINDRIFKDIPSLMDNISRTTEHIRSKLLASEAPDIERRVLQLLPTVDGTTYVQDEDGGYWRSYMFIERAQTYDTPLSPAMAYQAAHAFGQFQCQLADLPGPRLHETIPAFHNTPRRIDALVAAIERDEHNRASSAKAEIDFVMERASDAGLLLRLQQEGQLAEIVTHNDTKLNNVMICDKTGEGICVIDLDTVMPGLALYDFGDLVRTSTCSAPEDERDLECMNMDITMFEALVAGYSAALGPMLTSLERELLAFSGKLITLEIGTRFLTDYINGDQYFKIHREGHNLDRARAQFALVRSIEMQMEPMNLLAEKYRG